MTAAKEPAAQTTGDDWLGDNLSYSSKVIKPFSESDYGELVSGSHKRRILHESLKTAEPSMEKVSKLSLEKSLSRNSASLSEISQPIPAEGIAGTA